MSRAQAKADLILRAHIEAKHPGANADGDGQALRDEHHTRHYVFGEAHGDGNGHHERETLWAFGSEEA